MSHRFPDRVSRSLGVVKRPASRAMVEHDSRSEIDFRFGEELLCDSDFKWTITKDTAYSMFHASKSLLFSAGYVEKSQWCPAAAIEEPARRTEVCCLPPLSPTFRRAKTAREAADYGLTYGEASANGTVHDAGEIFEIVSSYLAGEGFEPISRDRKGRCPAEGDNNTRSLNRTRLLALPGKTEPRKKYLTRSGLQCRRQPRSGAP